MKKAALISVLLMLILAVSCGGSKDSDPKDKDDVTDGTSTQEDMLEGLGVDTDIGMRTNPAGEEVGDDYNPVGKPITQMCKRSEIFLAGIQGQGNSATKFSPSGEYNAMLDWADGASDYTRYGITGDQTWLQLPKAMSSGDTDGDGADELIITYLTSTSTVAGKERDLMVRIFDFEDKAFTKSSEKLIASYKTADLTEYPNDYYWMNNFNAVSGDVDNNGQYETLIAFNGSLFLLGDKEKDYGTVKTITYTKSDDTAYKLLKISAGDMDNVAGDEFVVVENNLQANTLYGSALYHIYSTVTMTDIASASIGTTEGASTITLHSANAAVGDLDTDGLNEVLFIGQPSGVNTYYMMILDMTYDEASSKFTYSFLPDFESFATSDSAYVTPICAIADFDGDAKKEIIGHRFMYENFAETGGVFTKSTACADVFSPAAGPTSGPATGYTGNGNAWHCSLTVGDIDGDAKQDVIMHTDGFEEVYWCGFNDSGVWSRKAHGDTTGFKYPAVVTGDFDGDSIVLEFIESETLFSDPHPIAVLAANPYWEGITMDGSTSFGTSTGSEVEKEQSMGLSVGFSVGYETEGPFNLWSASFKVSVESSFDWTATQSVSIEESYSYTTSNEDQVVFTTIPYDVYYYKVIKGPDSDMVGTKISVNLPRKAITLPVERTFYNDHNGECQDIDSTILTHTVGDPLTYPKSADADTLIASGGGQGLKSAKTMSVGQGSGSTAIEMSITNSEGTGSSFDVGVSIEAEVGAGGFTVGASAGFHYGESYSMTTSEGTMFGGEVANIPAGDWSIDKSFTWGLFSYRATAGSDEFIVVQYYMN